MKTTIQQDNQCFQYKARLTSWHRMMSYLVISRNGEQLLNPEEDRATGIRLLM